MTEGDPRYRLARALHWSVTTTTGVVVAKPCRLYYARLAATTSGAQVATAILYDDADGSRTTLGRLALMTTTNTGPDDWPRVPVSLGFLKGIDVAISGTNVGLWLGYDWD